MSSYSKARRTESDRFLPRIKQIVGPYLLEESSFEVDTRQATDLVVLRAQGLAIACRVRTPGYYEKYPYDFTVRSELHTGAQTELSKIYDGWADWMFYGHAMEEDDCGKPDFIAWMLLNLDSFRSQMIKYHKSIQWKRHSNNDGTWFIAFDIRSFKPHPPLLIASQGILEPDPAYNIPFDDWVSTSAPTSAREGSPRPARTGRR